MNDRMSDDIVMHFLIPVAAIAAALGYFAHAWRISLDPEGYAARIKALEFDRKQRAESATASSGK